MTLEDANKRMSTLLLQEENYKLLVKEAKANLVRVRKEIRNLKTLRGEIRKNTIEPFKVCKHCNERKPNTTEFYHVQHKYADGRRRLNTRCKICINTELSSYCKNRRATNKEYRERDKKRSREYYASLDKEGIEKKRIRNKNSDSTMKSHIHISTGIPKELITNDMIETKRNIIKLKRLIHDKTRAI